MRFLRNEIDPTDGNDKFLVNITELLIILPWLPSQRIVLRIMLSQDKRSRCLRTLTLCGCFLFAKELKYRHLHRSLLIYSKQVVNTTYAPGLLFLLPQS